MRISSCALAMLCALSARAVAQPSPEPEQNNGDASCQKVAATRQLPLSGAANHHCALLAEDVLSKVRERTRQRPVPIAGFNASQPAITDTPGAQVSAGQTAAIASGQPVAATGGNVAAVGATGQGLQFVTALAINPASIAIGDTSTRSVWASRLGDLSLVLPLNVDPTEGMRKGFQYIGGRFRINAIPAIRRQALEDVVAGYSALVVDQSTLQPQVTQVLASASNTARCAEAIEAADPAAQVMHCGTAIDLAALSRTTQQARRALTEFREQADRQYLSLEGRYDRGDLDADGAGRKDSLLAVYLAGGYQLIPTSNGVATAIRTRAGVVYFQDGMTRQSQYAFYGAIGLEIAAVRDLRRYTLSAAAELVKRDGDAELGTGDALRNALRIGLGLPIADGKTISVGLSIPADGGEPMLAVSGDWSLLLQH